MAVDPQMAFEVIDLRAVGDCEQVRLALTYGIELPYLASPKYLIRCADDLVVGPITLVFDSSGKATLEKNNRARIHCYQLAENAFLGINSNGETRTILAGNLPPTPYSYVDWDEDRLVMRRAIEAAAKTERKRHKPAEATDRGCDRATDAVRSRRQLHDSKSTA